MKVSFGELFRQYRLKAGFGTLGELGDALALLGFGYENSILSRWQNGSRVPNSRELVLTLVRIFLEKKAMGTVEEANEFLEAAGQGALSQRELQGLSFATAKRTTLHIPDSISDFTGREELVARVSREIRERKVVHIYGTAGVGKTTLAIKLGHVLQFDFPDGVFWYRVDSMKLREVLLDIAGHFGERRVSQKNKDQLVSVVRSLLLEKRVLLILDNVERQSDIGLLLSNLGSASVLVVSRYKSLSLPAHALHVGVESFSEVELVALFQRNLVAEDVKKYHQSLVRIGKSVGNLPLAVHIFAKQLSQSSLSPEDLLYQIERELSLENFSYEDKNLFLAIQVSYANLSDRARRVFLSLGVFEGRDFSVEAIGYVNGLSREETRIVLDELYMGSLIELSLSEKFRVHLMVKRFISEELQNPNLSRFLKVIGWLFVSFTFFWMLVQIQQASALDNFSRHFFGTSYFVVALLGGLLGVRISGRWGGLRSVMGKAVLFFSCGLLFQVVGQLSYSYDDIFRHIAIPYPSFGDIWYFWTFPFYISGVFYLAKACGIRLNLLFLKKVWKLILIFLGILIFLYVFLLFPRYIFSWSNWVKIFLDFGYPLVDLTYVFLGLVLYFQLKSMKQFGMRNKMSLILIALILQFLTDYVFVYQANQNAFHVGGLVDYICFLAYVFMALGILGLNSFMKRVLV